MIDFQSTSYYLFALCVFFIYQFSSKNIKKYILFVANLIFLALFFYYKKKQLIILGGFLGYNYLLLLSYQKLNYKKSIAWIQVVSSISFLCFFKYDLFQTPILAIFPRLVWLLKPAVFIGISFFSFRLLSIIFDTLYNSRKKELDFFHFINFLVFFPCYLSGPLDRYDRFVGDVEDSTRLSSEEIYNSLYRIVWGAFKKGIIADTLYNFCLDSVATKEMALLPTSKIIISHYIYLLVLYFDFSGYSDIAIGVSQLFNIKTPENFNNPLLKRNIQEFWNSWHITFIHWLRDYLYIPIQRTLIKFGYKNFVAVACISYMAVFILAGIWHGDTLQYFIYGLLQGIAFTVFLVYKKLLESRLSREQKKWYKKSKVIKWMATGVTINYFLMSLVFFIHKGQVYTLIWGRIFE